MNMQVTDYQTIKVTPLSPTVGAEISGIDLTKPISDTQVQDILNAHANYGVIFFRDQQLTPEQHIAFAERCGVININRFFKPVDDYPKVAQVLKEPHQQANIGGGWHTDHSYDQLPAMGSVLYALEVPPTGGDTMFASMGAAYDALSDGLKETLESLNALHSSRHVFGGPREAAGDRIGNPELATQDAIHPVVIKHPVSGRKTLYVNPGFTLQFEGWTAEESQPLLQYLYRHAAKPEFVYRFQWQPGSVAFWDNRAVWHYALNDYHGQRRLMHRITLEGGALEAA
ncbi:MAG: TauD/TfdA family dioxygenase [Pseudomonadota bacterium]